MRDLDAEQSRVEILIFQKYPQLEDMLTSDLQRTHLRVLLRCPTGHPIETVVLDADHNWHLFVVSQIAYDNMNPDIDDPSAHHAVSATKGRTEGLRTASDPRVKLPCPQKNCAYNGVKTQAELLKLFVLARFVLNTPDIRLPD